MIAALALLLAAAQPAEPAASELPIRTVPQAAGTTRFAEPSVALADPRLPRDAPLVVFLPGTGGNPANNAAFLRVIAGQGYRVIGLHYPDVPAVVGICPQDPDPTCSAKFRAMRVAGSGPGVGSVQNSVADSIDGRLVHALQTLAAEDPRGPWGGYLDGSRPRWGRIVISGLSQGAGMAAYIAKQHEVRRVVLFSSPWDFQGTPANATLAPWLRDPSATPMSRWFAEYNQRERTADLLARAYPMLGIPAGNVTVFNLELPAAVLARARTNNPYHGTTIRDMRYADQWRQMFGRGDQPAP